MANLLTIAFVVGDTEHQLPACYKVCPRCSGTGTHVNPSIDGNGLTCEAFAEAGDDFRADYMAGLYDVPCIECSGRRVVLELDRVRCPKALRKAYDEFQREEHQYQATCRAERRAEMGWHHG